MLFRSHAKFTLFSEGTRGSLSKFLIHNFNLSEGKDFQKYAIGLKEVWEIKEENFSEGLVEHSMGWPLSDGTNGGSFLYHFDKNLVSIGYVIHLNYTNPYASPFDEFQQFKTHPSVKKTLKTFLFGCATVLGIDLIISELDTFLVS